MQKREHEYNSLWKSGSEFNSGSQATGTNQEPLAVPGPSGLSSTATAMTPAITYTLSLLEDRSRGSSTSHVLQLEISFLRKFLGRFTGINFSMFISDNS